MLVASPDCLQAYKSRLVFLVARLLLLLLIHSACLERPILGVVKAMEEVQCLDVFSHPLGLSEFLLPFSFGKCHEIFAVHQKHFECAHLDSLVCLHSCQCHHFINIAFTTHFVSLDYGLP
jgi:hypothetical protein